MKDYQLISVEIYDETLEKSVPSEMLKVTEGEKIWWVTPNSNSRRWREYLEWMSEGNTPEVIND